MKKVILSAILALGLVTFTGCSSKPAEEANTTVETNTTVEASVEAPAVEANTTETNTTETPVETK